MDGKGTKNIFRHPSSIPALLFLFFITAGLIIPAGACFAKEYYLVPRLVHSSHVLRLGDFIADLGRGDTDRLLDPFPVHIEPPAVVSAEAVRRGMEETGRRDFILVGTYSLVVPGTDGEKYYRLLAFLRDELDTEGGWIEVSVEPEQLKMISGRTVFLSIEKKDSSYAGYTSRFQHPNYLVRFRPGDKGSADEEDRTAAGSVGSSGGVFDGGSETLEVTVQKHVSGFEAAGRLEAHQKIEPDDLRQSYVVLKDEDNPPVSAEILETGYIAKRTISSGEPVFSEDVEKETLMESGSRISIRIKKGNITMRLEGIVYGSGGLGDRVRVKPVRADRSLHGRIISRREVVVEGL